MVALTFAGLLLGLWLRHHMRLGPALARLMGLLIYPLVLVQGVFIGQSPGLVARLPSLGGQALLVAGLSIGLSILAVRLLMRTPRAPEEATERAAPPPARLRHALAASGRVVGAVLLGVLLGRWGWWPELVAPHSASAWLLRALLFVVGLELGSSPGQLKHLSRSGLQLLKLPLAAILGSLGAGLILWPWLGAGGLSAAAGLGWYTLAGPMTTEVLGVAAGTVAFLASLFRELSVLTLAPLLVRTAGGLETIAAAGAPAMDTSLPFLVRAGGQHLALPALLSGGICSLLTPWLLSLALSSAPL